MLSRGLLQATVGAVGRLAGQAVRPTVMSLTRTRVRDIMCGGILGCVTKGWVHVGGVVCRAKALGQGNGAALAGRLLGASIGFSGQVGALLFAFGSPAQLCVIPG